MQKNKQPDLPSTNSKPTFLIRILFRQNKSWQGEIQWIEGHQKKRFRSALELIMLIHEVMDLADDDVYRLRHWSDDETEGETPFSSDVLG